VRNKTVFGNFCGKIVRNMNRSRYACATLIFSLTQEDIGDRGQVFRLIHLYVHKLDPGNDSVELVELKFSFLRVLSFHDFFIPLNMPVQPAVPAVPEIFSVFLYVSVWWDQFGVSALKKSVFQPF